jgi:hypothetical protein
MTETNFLSLEEKFKELEPGGHYKPPDCRSHHKVAIVIPYRNREKHLRIFLNNMHPFLQKQQLEYGIYVVEQVGTISDCLTVSQFFSLVINESTSSTL